MRKQLGLDRVPAVVHYGPMANPTSPTKMELVIAATKEIERMQSGLEEAKARLAALLEITGPTVALPRRLRQATDVNVSATVYNYLLQHPEGVRAVDLIHRLKLEDRSTAVRSALKKHAVMGRLKNVHGVWSVVENKKGTHWAPRQATLGE